MTSTLKSRKSTTLRYSMLGIAILVFVSGTAQKSWKKITTVEEVCESYPKQIKKMMQRFDLEYKGFEKVKKASEEDNMVQACTYLLDYYKNGTTSAHLRRGRPVKTDKTVAKADTILKNVFVVQNVRGKVPYGPDGHRDWYYKGPNNDREWAWLSNRHSQINYLFDTYLETGNPKYANYIDAFLRDFIIKSMPYPGVESSTSVWRGLEVAARAKVWTRIFYGLLNDEHISDATRLLMLSSLPDHAHYSRNFHKENNWLTMEISALATIAANFPEYRKSDGWLGYSIDTMIASMKAQVYPDGVQTELTSHYHNVARANFELFKNICESTDKKLPDFFDSTIEAMYAYIAHTVRPDGFGALNNDGDRDNNRDLILSGAKRYNNGEWEYIATNGENGTIPTDGPSYFYPWAGQLVSRSGYGSDAHWSFFDIGPWGTGHQHNDKLHISISAYGRDFLVDSGRFAYTGKTADKFRPYARSSNGHNVILLDNQGQNDRPPLAKAPLDASHFKITDEFDYASNTFGDFKGLSGKAEHSRVLFYVRGKFWVVVDRILTDRPRKIDALWHWHPQCKVQKEGSVVKTDNERGNLAIIPIGKQKFDIELVKGQEKPEPQGWYSPKYNVFEPNITSIYSTEIKDNTNFVWVLFPSKGKVPGIKAKIIAENDTEIEVEVTSNNNIWRLSIPFTDSANAGFIKN